MMTVIAKMQTLTSKILAQATPYRISHSPFNMNWMNTCTGVPKKIKCSKLNRIKTSFGKFGILDLREALRRKRGGAMTYPLNITRLKKKL